MSSVFVAQRSELRLSASGYRPGGSSTQIWRAVGVGEHRLELFKEYNASARQVLDAARLEVLVSWRQHLPPADRKFLDSFCAFPTALVSNGDNDVVGILMPEAPSAFIQQRPKGTKPRQAEELGRRRESARKTEVPYFEPPHKLALLGVLLQRLTWLHDRSLIIADLQPRNLLVTADPDIREIYLLDCDSFWLGDLHAFPPHDPPMYHVGSQDFTPATDLAKFARLVCRTVCEDFSIETFPSQPLHEILPSQHIRQLERMWSVDPSLPAEKLHGMAHTWTNLVKVAPGRPTTMYVWTESAGRRRWYPSDPAAGTRPHLGTPSPVPVTPVTPPGAVAPPPGVGGPDFAVPRLSTPSPPAPRWQIPPWVGCAAGFAVGAALVLTATSRNTFTVDRMPHPTPTRSGDSAPAVTPRTARPWFVDSLRSKPRPWSTSSDPADCGYSVRGDGYHVTASDNRFACAAWAGFIRRVRNVSVSANVAFRRSARLANEPNASWAGVMCRERSLYGDAGYRAIITSDGYADIETDPGAPSPVRTLGEATFTPRASRTYRLQFECINRTNRTTELRLTVDGVRVVKAMDKQQLPDGYVGLTVANVAGTSGLTEVVFTNFSVTGR